MIKRISVFGKAALPIISNEHNRIHGGSLFTAQVVSAALGAAASLYIEMNVPEGIEVHVKGITFYNGDDGEYELIEAPTLTTGTTPLVSLNRNRKAPNLSNLVLKSDPTTISGGTLLDNVFFKGTNQSPGILLVDDLEWVLKEDEVYLFRLTNNGASSEQALLKINWYECVE